MYGYVVKRRVPRRLWRLIRPLGVRWPLRHWLLTPFTIDEHHLYLHSDQRYQTRQR